jgi:N4-acetylcytidine amidohydrolase
MYTLMELNNNGILPPKTCTVERLMTIVADLEKVMAGRKTAVRRNGHYADIGENLQFRGKEFILEKVYRRSLGDMKEKHAYHVGYVSLEEYKNSILSVHSRMKWLASMKVWVHEFRPVEE